MKKKFSAALRLSTLPFLCVSLLATSPLGARDDAPDTDADFGTHYYVFERGCFRQIHFVHKLPHEEGGGL